MTARRRGRVVLACALAVLALGTGTGWATQAASMRIWTDPQTVLWERLLAQATLLYLVYLVAGRLLGGELLRLLRRTQERPALDPLRYRGDAPGW